VRRSHRRSGQWTAAVAALILGGCAGERPCPECSTLVIAATGEPSSLFPPLVFETVGRDISDQVFERLAVLKPGGATIDSSAYAPALAERWVRVSDTSWRFYLRPDAKWHDGARVTAEDVVFSFGVFADSALDAAARPVLAGQVAAEAEDSATVLIRFVRDYPEQLYDATWHVRVLPAHIWRAIPREEWPADTSLAHLVGSGPYRVAAWVRGQSLRLAEPAPLGRSRCDGTPGLTGAGGASPSRYRTPPPPVPFRRLRLSRLPDPGRAGEASPDPRQPGTPQGARDGRESTAPRRSNPWAGHEGAAGAYVTPALGA
jgi:ABC-type transport system substrate-binding protein